MLLARAARFSSSLKSRVAFFVGIFAQSLIVVGATLKFGFDHLITIGDGPKSFRDVGDLVFTVGGYLLVIDGIVFLTVITLEAAEKALRIGASKSER
jgi:hypothetical protein